MGLKFYFGGSGAGKSKRLHQDIIDWAVAEPETNFLVIVPDQFTMQTQMDLVMAHPDKGIMNIDVLSFGRLAHRIFEETGEDERTVLDDTGKSLVLRLVASRVKDRLPAIGSNLSRLGYINEVKSAVSEFMQYGVGKRELEQLMEFAGERGALHSKLKDLGCIYEEFLNYIHGSYITTEETLDLLREALNRSALVRGCVAAFDGFTGFTPVQYRVVLELMRLARQVMITLDIDAGEEPWETEGEQKLFYLSRKTVQDLTRMAGEARIPVKGKAGMADAAMGQGTAGSGMTAAGGGSFDDADVYLTARPVYRFRDNPEMAHLEQYIFRYPSSVYEGRNEAIRLFEAGTPVEEARQVCVNIKRLIREKNYAYRDFAVVTGDLEAYADPVERVFTQFGIPFFLDRTTGILLNPFIEYIRSALRIVLQDFSYESVFHYMRSGLADFTPEETDVLENYVLAAGIRGRGKWTSLFVRRAKGTEDADLKMEELNRLRERLVEQLAPLFVRAGTVGDMVRFLYEFIVDSRIQEKLARYEERFTREGEAARAREYGQIYRLVMDLLNQIYSLLKDETMTLQEFSDILDAGFGEMKVGSIPQNVDRIVVGDMERTRLKEVKVLFFMGINEGSIPRNTSKGGIISDIDREFLSGGPVELSPAPRRKMYIERLYLYMNMTKPSDCLYLSYAKVNGEGKSIRPAYLVDAMRSMFPSLKVERPEQESPLLRIETPADGLDCYSDMLRRYAAGTLREEERRQLYTLRRIYLQEEGYAGRVLGLEREAFRRYEDSPLGRAAARALYGTFLENSVSRLEKYASCAYSHFLEYGLRLRERDGYTFEAVDMGNVFHGVLEGFARKLEERGRTWFDFTGEEGDELVDRALEECAAQYGDTILYSSARNEYMLERIGRILRRTVRTLQYQLKKGVFIPESFELSFSVTDDLGAVNIALSDEERMRLRGRIDRLDTAEDEEHVYVKVIDYKSGSRKFDLAALYYGLQLQLVVYMNVAVEEEKRRHPDKQVIPAALLYYHVADPILKVEEELQPEEINARLVQELRMTGMVNGNDTIISMLDGSFSDKSDILPVERKKDGSFSARSSVISEEDFQTISNYVNQKIRRFGREILDGNISVNPCEKGNTTACTYCAYRPVCGFDERIQGYRRKELPEEDERTLLDRMREEG